MEVAALNNDYSLFSLLYVLCQTSDGDLDSFLAHENQAAPTLLSLEGKLRLEKKKQIFFAVLNRR